MATAILKLCAHCGVEKPPEEFVKRNDAGSGRRGKCKACMNAAIALRLSAKDSEDQVRLKAYHAQKSREWYQRTKANAPERLKERNRYCASRRVAKKAEWVQKFGGTCSHCHQAHPDCVFEFHHVNGAEKEKTPAQLFMRSDEVIAAELSKCIMLCANCHRIEHDRLNYADHGRRKLVGKPEPKQRTGQRQFYGWRYRLGDDVFDSQQEAADKLGVSPSRISQMVSAPGSLWTKERCHKAYIEHVSREYPRAEPVDTAAHPIGAGEP
jgi:hypothetical protein